MSTSLTLLSIPHEAAIRSIVQDALLPGVSVSDLVIVNPRPTEGAGRVTDVFIAASAFSDPNWPYFGEATFQYRSQDLAEVFGHLDLTFQRTGSFTAQDLADEISQYTGVLLTEQDIHQQTHQITAMTTPFVIRASAASPRWHGVLPVTVVSGTYIQEA